MLIIKKIMLKRVTLVIYKKGNVETSNLGGLQKKIMLKRVTFNIEEKLFN